MEAPRSRELALQAYQALRAQGYSAVMTRAILQEEHGLTEAQLDDIAPLEKNELKRGPLSAMELRLELRGVAGYLCSMAKRIASPKFGWKELAALELELREKSERIERLLGGADGRSED